MPHYEDRKAMIAERVLARKRSKEAESEEFNVEVAAPEEEPISAVPDFSDIDMPEEDMGEAEEGLLSLQNVFQDVRDEAYQGYLTGVAFDENPYFKEGMTEDQDDPEFVLSEIWSEGWVSAHTDACTANLLLVARDMVATDDEEVLIGLYDDLTEAVEVLGEVLDFDSLHESWSELLG